MALLCVAWFVTAAPARADCGTEGAVVVQLHMDGPFEGPGFREAVQRELQAALRHRNLHVCQAPLPEGASVAAHLRLRAVEPHAVTMDVDDGVTAKRLSRRVDLASFPQDSRPLATAVAADELLRASWIELALADAPAPPKPPPVEVLEVVERDVAPGRARRTSVGARAAFDHYAAGDSQLGADAFVALRFGDRWGLELSAGARRGAPQRSDHGEVRSLSLGGGLAWLIHAVDRPNGGLVLAVDVRAAQVGLDGRARNGQRDGAGNGTTLAAGASLRTTIHLHRRLKWQLNAGGGGVLLGVIATDEGRDVTGVAGWQVNAQTGFEVLF